MLGVHKAKSRATDLYDGARRGRERTAKSACSWFVLALAITVGTAVEVGIDHRTLICHEPSLSRGSVAGTKLQHPADASLTIWWREFKQA
jgi:hypothetical protein